MVGLGAVISRSGKQAQGGLSTLRSQELIGCPSITFDSLDSGQLFERRRHAKRTNDMSVGEFFGGAWTFIVNMPLWAGVGVGVVLLFLCFMAFLLFLDMFG